MQFYVCAYLLTGIQYNGKLTEHISDCDRPGEDLWISTLILTQIIPQIINPEKTRSFCTILITHKKPLLIHMIQI